MSCKDVRGLIPLYLYGELSFDEEERVEQHLAVCAECQAERARCEKLTSLLEQGEAGVSAELLARCRRDLSAALEKERRRRGWAAAAGRFSVRCLHRTIPAMPTRGSHSMCRPGWTATGNCECISSTCSPASRWCGFKARCRARGCGPELSGSWPIRREFAA